MGGNDAILLRPSAGSPTGTVFLCDRGGRLCPGDVVKPRRGVVYLKAQSALLDREEWPPHVYELAPQGLVIHGELVARTASARVVREVELSEVMGPHVDAYIDFLEELAAVRWLAPRALISLAEIQSLVAEHYKALAAYGPVTPAPVRIVSTLDLAQHTFGHAFETPLSATAMKHAMSIAYPEETTFPLTLAENTAVRRAAPALFKAAWGRAAAEHVVAMASQGRAVDRVANIVRKGEGDGLRAMRTVVEQTMVRDRELGPVLKRILETPAFFTGGLSEREHQTAVWIATANAVNSGTHTARSVAGGVLLGVEEDPWRPLFELFKLGIWPIGEADGEFAVYVPAPAS